MSETIMTTEHLAVRELLAARRDVFPVQLLKRPISAAAMDDAVAI